MAQTTTDQNSLQGKLARALFKTKLAHAFTTRLDKLKNSIDQFQAREQSQRQASPIKHKYIGRGSLIKKSKERQNRQTEYIQKELTEKIQRGDIQLCNYEEVKRKIRQAEENYQKIQETTQREESTDGLPYFIQINQKKEEKVLKNFEVQEQSWKNVSEVLETKVGRDKNKQLLSTSTQSFRRKVENKNNLHELQGQSETLNANDYWKSTLRNRIASEQSGQRFLRTTQKQDQKEKKEYEKQLLKELQEISQEPYTQKQIREQEISMRQIIKQLQANKEKEEDKYVFIVDDEYAKTMPNFYSVDHIEKTNQDSSQDVSLKDYIKSACKINPKWKYIQYENPYLFEPKLNDCVIFGKNKFNLEKQVFEKQEDSKRLQNYYSYKPEKDDYGEEIIINTYKGLDIDYIKCGK